VKVLAVEGNRIRLSRKAILKEQRAKMGGGGGEVPVAEPQATPITIEGGGDFEDDGEEPNFNREDTPHSVAPAGDRPDRGDRGPRGAGGGGGAGGRRRRGRGGHNGRGGSHGGHGGPRR